MTDYREMCNELQGLVENVPHKIANLANASALLFNTMGGVNWAGFYLVEGEKLVLGPFQGNVACIEIPKGKGVCGLAFQMGETVVVGDVHEFKGHIACDSRSNSEIVIPIKKNGEVVAVLDIDSPLFERFTDYDRQGLTEFVEILTTAI